MARIHCDGPRYSQCVMPQRLIIMQMDKVTDIRKLADGPLEPAEAEPGTVNAAASSGVESNEPDSVIGVFAIGGIDDAAE